MCLQLKHLELADVYRKVTAEIPERERRIQKFPSRERNYAIRRKNDNNNFRPHVNCQSCEKVAEREKNNQNGWEVAWSSDDYVCSLPISDLGLVMDALCSSCFRVCWHKYQQSCVLSVLEIVLVATLWRNNADWPNSDIVTQ